MKSEIAARLTALERKMESKYKTLTLYVPIDSIFWFDTHALGWSIVYLEGSQVITLPLKIVLFMADGVDTDEIRSYVAFYLGPHCLQKK